MTERIDLETLVSYVDGQLEERETRRVEAVLARDAEARESVRGLRESAEVLRSAFNEALNEPLPARVLESIGRAAADRAAGRWHPSWPVALAASLAMLIVGFGGGALLVDLRVEQELAELRAVELADQQAREAALFQALEQHVSGEAVAWRNPDSGRAGEITPVRTFKNRQEQWCREYRAEEVLAGESEVRLAIACRGPEGLWKTRAVLLSDT
jgi:surface antigen